MKQPKRTIAREATSNVVPIRAAKEREQRRADDAAKAYAVEERHRVALEFARELVALLSAGVPVPDDDWTDPTPDPDFGSRDRAWVDPDGWQRWQALKAAEAARKHWIALGRQDDMPRRIRAVRTALDLAARWKGPPVDAAFIRSEAATDAPELAAIPITDWATAIERWPAEKSKRGGDHRNRGTPWYVVAFDLLKPHGLTNAKDAQAMERACRVAPKKAQRRRAK